MVERTYGGIEANQRVAHRRAQIIEAALDILAKPDGATAFGVRSVCRSAGLTARYFYESFNDPASLAATIYDDTVESVAASTLAAVADQTDVETMATHGITGLVAALEQDTQIGRAHV